MTWDELQKAWKKLKQREYAAKWRKRNPEKVEQVRREFYQRYKEKLKPINAAKSLKWYHANRDKAKKTAQEFRRKNPNYASIRYEEDLQFKMRHILRSRLREALRGSFKSGSSVEALGCSVAEALRHIENQFQPGMTWDNWSFEGWHLDHKVPLSSFDLSDPEQFAKANHYTNLQPLWGRDNMAKGAKIYADF